MSDTQAERPTSIARVTVLLAGEQRASISTRHARTPEARVVLTWATVMMTFSTRAQVIAFRDAFVAATPAAGPLPLVVDPQVLAGSLDYAAYMPVVSVVFTATPDAVVAPGSTTDPRVGWAHTRRWVDIRVGGVMFRLMDRQAHTSGLAALEDVLTVARTSLAIAPRRRR